MAGLEFSYDAFDLKRARHIWGVRQARVRSLSDMGAPREDVERAEARALAARLTVERIERYLLDLDRGRPQGVRLEE